MKPSTPAAPPPPQLQNLLMQVSALTIALRHACRLVPGLESAVRASAQRAEDELSATTLTDASIEAVAAQLMIICGPAREHTNHAADDPP